MVLSNKNEPRRILFPDASGLHGKAVLLQGCRTAGGSIGEKGAGGKRRVANLEDKHYYHFASDDSLHLFQLSLNKSSDFDM